MPVSAAAAPACSAPEGTAGIAAPLPHVAEVMRPGGKLDVLVVGSATVFGPDASLTPGTITSQLMGRPASGAAQPVVASAAAFPNRMAEAVRAAHPGVTVQVTIRGARTMSADEMLGVLRTELAARPYQLVIWQTGTLEAVRNVQPGDFAQTLADGEQAVRDAKADLILVDPQYSRFLQTNANLDPYFQAFQQSAVAPDVVWFRRYDLMRSWVSDGQIDLEHVAKADRKHVLDQLHACIGEQLASLIDSSARN